MTRGGPQFKIAKSEDDLNGSEPNVTGLLHARGTGDLAARDELVAAVDEELRRRAAARLRHRRARHVLQPTALVHEACLRLINQPHTDWRNRAHSFALASAMMRRILVDHARRRQMGKRSGGWARVMLDEVVAARSTRRRSSRSGRAALGFAFFDPRERQVAEQRFFGGLSRRRAEYA